MSESDEQFREKRKESSSAEGCRGCQWVSAGEEGSWCHMLQNKPDVLPCSQHDRFQMERDIMVGLYKDHPKVFVAITKGIFLKALSEEL